MHKARLFQGALEIGAEGALELRKALLIAVKECDAVFGRFDRFGQRYTVDFPFQYRQKCDNTKRLDNRPWLGYPEIDDRLSALMAMDKFKLLDVVALTVDLPEYNLKRGQVGTIVEVLADGEAFEVEFSDRDGRTVESIGIEPHQMMPLIYEPGSLAAA